MCVQLIYDRPVGYYGGRKLLKGCSVVPASRCCSLGINVDDEGKVLHRGVGDVETISICR